MMAIGAFEAKNRLSELLGRVAAGEEVVITRRGVPVARLVPAGGVDPRTARRAAERIWQRGRRATFGDRNVDEQRP